MMLEVERNNGQEVNLPQISAVVQDNITTTNVDFYQSNKTRSSIIRKEKRWLKKN